MIGGRFGGSFHQVVYRVRLLLLAKNLSPESQLGGETFGLCFGSEVDLGTFEVAGVGRLSVVV